ncbi:uncharacterized protein LOC127872348 [Dreissena polymorpha]|nr:uncharacterized protein LOC127872348 [Dreissena polymorpha]
MSATDLQSQSAKINTILDQLMKLQTNWESNMKTLQTSYEEQLKELTSVRQKINAALDKLEKTTLKEMDEVKAVLYASLKSDADECFRFRTELTRLSEAIQEAGKKSKELTFIAYQKSEEMIKQADRCLNQNSIQTELSLKFIVDNDTEGCLSNLSRLGHTVHVTKGLTIQGRQDLAITVASTTPISVKIPCDKSTSYIIMGMCSLFNGQILLADHINNRLKLLDLQHNVVSFCDMSGSPYDMCLITPCQVAVAVGKGIQFVSVHSGQLVKERDIQLPHECIGVAHHHGDLFVTSGTALYKYNLTGTLVKMMYEDTSIYSTVWWCAVSPSADKIYVTNHVDHKLLTLASDGTVISTFTDPEMKGPSGVHVTPAGQLLICCLLSNSLIQVDRKGKQKIATVATQKDGLKNPRSVLYNWKSGSVIVGNSNENILVMNLI